MKIVVFEGPDGSGKSSLIKELKKRLEDLDPKYKVVVTGSLDGEVGELVRCLTTKTARPSPAYILLAHEHSRRRVLDQIKSMKSKTDLLLIDRWALSTWVYDLQCTNTHAHFLRSMEELNELGPVTTVLLDADDSILDKRISIIPDQLEKDAVLQARVRKSYRGIKEETPPLLEGHKLVFLNTNDRLLNKVEELTQMLFKKQPLQMIHFNVDDDGVVSAPLKGLDHGNQINLLS